MIFLPIRATRKIISFLVWWALRKDNFFHLVKFKIMGLCGDFSLLLQRPEMMLNEIFDDIFFES